MSILKLTEERDRARDEVMNLKDHLAEVEAELKITKAFWKGISDELKIEQDKIRDVSELVDSAYEDEVEIVKTVCHNTLKEPLFGEKLQEIVIFHLKNLKSNLEAALLVGMEAEK